MRQLFIFLALFNFTISRGQQIELLGKYGASFIGGESIEFIKKDSFYFSGFYCTYGMSGKGLCEIRGGYLYLYFEKSKNTLSADSLKSPQILKQETAGNFCAVSIKCVDNEGKPIPYASVVLKKDGRMIVGSMADESGSANFRVDKINFPVTVDITSVETDPAKIILKDFANYTIKVFNRMNYLQDKELNNGEVFIYEIDELSEDSILMRPKDSNGPYRNYRKLK